MLCSLPREQMLSLQLHLYNILGFRGTQVKEHYLFLLEEAAFVFHNKLWEGIIICIPHTLWTLVRKTATQGCLFTFLCFLENQCSLKPVRVISTPTPFATVNVKTKTTGYLPVNAASITQVWRRTVQDVSTSTFANSVHLYLLLLQCPETFSALRSKVNICYHAPDSRMHLKNLRHFHRQISLHFCQLLPACQSWAMVTNIFF